MKFKKLLTVFILLIHLQVTAGELINISGITTLKPLISVKLTPEQVAYLDTDVLPKGAEFLTLHMLVNDKPAKIAVAGKYTIEGTILSYTPMYTLGYGIVFEVHYTNNDKQTFTKRFKTPPHILSGISPTVITAYPLSDIIPYNTLYFHVRFSHSMQYDKLAYQHIKLYDENGVERKNAWRQQCAWADDGKLLVLMIHPGRVKNGIHYESPMFDSGKQYTLKVLTGINDINGNTIEKEFTQSFRVSGVDKHSPKPLFNKINIPAKGTLQPLILSFSEGMDNASVLDGVKLQDKNGKYITCTIREHNTDAEYIITPNKNWLSGSYTLVLKSTVYDFAANRINRLFEITDASEMEKDKTDTEWAFEIK